MINLLLIDPQPVVRCGFKTFLSDFDFLNVVYVAEDINGAIDFIKSNPVDVLISEMTFSDISPVKLIKKVKKTNPEIDVIFFTSQDQQIYSVPLLRAGTTGFLSKNIKASVMADAIHKIKSFKLHITNNFNNELKLDLDIEKPRNRFGTLSSREIEVLKYLTDGKRNIEIAERLNINQKTVNTYKNRMMHKLKVDNMFDLYLQAKNMNLV
ncbi:MAG: response regulator transcription factor [Flavobacteriaceae bacterium]|jgi:DNA-binding NarL/FixJ family response regulator|nr:response regulator transcription factor [Flavobacteriaceae bacterium]MDG1941588.1 response regulator transcription factor [Flavobacteriaceae bacterium]|tara:strand:- start:2469 stop:3098 length:630 start_codon:yes stop_codon:yes gene_type:complete